MEIKDLAEKLNGKLDSIEQNIKSVEDKAAAQGQMSENLEKELKSLQDNHKEVQGMIETQQKHLDELEASKKRMAGTSFKGSLEQSMDKIKAFAQGESSKLNLNVKADILNSTHSGDVVEQARLSGVYHTPDRSNHVRSRMNTTPFSTETIRYIQETAYTDNAGTRAEGSAGSQSDLTLTEQTATSKIISTYVTVSKESLSDINYLANHIQTRGMSKIMLEEDNQILYGSGAGNNLSGISVNADAWSDGLADSNVNRFDVLGTGVTQARVNEYNPNVIYVHPTDYDLMVRAKDSEGRYLFPDALFNNRPLFIYGAEVVPTTAVTSDDFFIGDFAMGATLGIREDVTITSSDSHASQFTAGLVTLLIEERIALPIYRTDAFVYGDFSNALALGSA